MFGGTILTSLALLTLLTGVIVLSCPSAFSSSPVEIYVSPQPIFVEEDSSFSVWINIGNVESPGVFAYQIALCYDPGCLEATNATIPEHHFLTPSSPMNVFIIDGGTIDKELGRVSFAVTLLGPEEGRTGSGVLACVEFTAVSQGISSLTFTDVILVDSEANEIPSSQIVLENASVNVGAGTPAPPSSPFKVYVDSQSSFMNVGQKFSVRIYIVKAPLPGIFAYKFSLGYNCTMFEAAAAGMPEGSFLDTSSPETFSIIDNGTIDSVSGIVSFEATRSAPEDGRTGNGLLGSVEFLAVASGNSSLTIDDMTLADKDGNPFPSSQYERVPARIIVPSNPPPPPAPPPAYNTEVYVSPIHSSIEVNETLQISVFITNVSSPGLFSYQFAIHYDCAIVKAVVAEIPEGHFLTPSSPERIFIVDGGTIDNTLGKVSFAATLLGPEEGKTGDGVLATIQFKAIATGDMTFQLEDVTLVSPYGTAFFGYREGQGTATTVLPEFQSVAMLQALLLVATFVIIITRKMKTHRFT